MGMQYMILNYAAKTIMRGLTSAEVCTLLKYFMTQPSPSFAVVSHNEVFCTNDFAQKTDGSWVYEPRPQERSM